jgi:hypothetical protein
MALTGEWASVLAGKGGSPAAAPGEPEYPTGARHGGPGYLLVASFDRAVYWTKVGFPTEPTSKRANRAGEGLGAPAPRALGRNTLGAALTFGLALKTERWICPNCGGPAQRNSALRPQGRQSRQWHCEKNDHLLTAKHRTCPIDGSRVRQI